jgi:hypothetical protein
VYTALFLLNKSLNRLSRDRFDIGEFGQPNTAAQSDAKSTDAHPASRGSTHLAKKYQSLWMEIPQEMLDEEGGRLTDFMQNLAATGLMGYPSDISEESYEAHPEDRIPSELHHSAIQLVGALVEFHTRFHGWRIFVGEEIGTTLNELFQITMLQQNDRTKAVLTSRIPAVTSKLCDNTSQLNQGYTYLVPTFVEYRGGGDEELDLEARAQRFAEYMPEADNLS